MLEDTQYEYLVKFFDGGSVKRLQTQIANMERAIQSFQSKVKLANGEVAKLIDAQAVASAQGFSSNPKLDRAANSYVAGGGAEAERRQAQKRGIIAKRTTEEAQVILDLHRDARQRLRKFYTELEQKQIVNLTALSRQQFLDKEVTSLKQAQVKLEAAKLRAAQAFRADLNNKDGRSNGRLRRELGEAEGDVSTIEAQVAEMRKLESVTKRVDAQQTKMNAALERANIERREGNTLEARKELLKARQAKAQALTARQESLTTQELRQQVALNRSIERSKQRIKTLSAAPQGDPLERRLQDGGAGLFKIQAQLLANYAAMGLALQTLSFAGRFIVDLDKQFAQLQAITATTDESMDKLEKTVIRVSEGVKFTALEVAEAATVMGQAGFSVDQITSSIEDITLLATAVGTDLNTAVDLVTSTISVFNLRSEEAGVVANVFTTAVNNSKLNLEKLTLGLQYAGNIANEQNITFSELTATLGAMANSGIRSGSTLGTGLRQILTALAAPSAKLQGRLEQLGLSTDDVNVKLHGLTGVLTNLQEAGFTTSDALQVLEVRAGAAYAALTNNSATIEDLRRQFLLTTAATEANAVQMEALANKGARLQSVFGTVVAKAFDPLLEVTKEAIDLVAAFLSVLNRLGPILPAVTTVVVAYTAAVVANRAALLVRNLAGKAAISGMLGEAAAAKAASLGYKGLLASLGPVGIAIVTVTSVLSLAKLGIDTFTVSVDELQSKLDESTGRLDTYTENIRSLDKEIEILSQRHFDASTSMQEVNNIALELQFKFGDLGGSFDFTTGKVQGLIPELERLRDTMLDIRNVELDINIQDSKALQDEQIKAARRSLNGITPRDVYRKTSLLSPFSANDNISRQGQEFSRRSFDDQELISFYQDIQNRRSRNTSLIRAIESGTLNEEQQSQIPSLVDELSRTGLGSGFFRDNKTDQDNLEDVRELLRLQNNYLNNFNDGLLPVLQTQNNILAQERAIEQNAFDRSGPAQSARAELVNLEQQLAAAKATSDLRTSEGRASVQEVVDLIAAQVEKNREDFSDNEQQFQTSGLSQMGEALLSRAQASLRLTETQQREENELFRLRQNAAQAEINTIQRSLNLQDNAITIAQGKQEALRIFDEKAREARQEEVAQLDQANASRELREARLAEVDREAVANRQRLVDAFDRMSLDREVEVRKISFQSLSQQLEQEIQLEKRRVNSRSSVYEIQQAKERALAAQGELEIAAREDLRFRLRNDTSLLAVEMMKLNNQLALDREQLGLSFDQMHEEIQDRQVPAIRNALKGLTESFDAARAAFERKIDDLDEPVEDLRSTRAAMDVEGNADRFSDVSRTRVDREIRAAEIDALRGELELLQTQGLANIQTRTAELEAFKADLDARITSAQQVLDNYNGGNNSTSPEEAKQAAAEIEQLRRQSLETDKEINSEAELMEARLARIRELQREIGAVTGEAAPSAMGWMESLNAGLQEYVNNLEKAQIKSDEFADVVVDVMGTAQDELGQAFFDILTGAKSVGEAFGDMAQAILKAILKILAEQVAIFAIKQLFAAFGFTPQTFSTGGQVPAFATGGQVPRRFARGGTIPNVGVVGRDYTPILAEAGEFVMRKSAVDSIGRDKLYAMNAMGKQAIGTEGGMQINLPEKMGGNKEVNVYVVSPEEKPQLGPDDIIHVISEDLAAGGQTKQLVKHVMMN